MNTYLASIAKTEARKFFHGNIMGSPTNLHPIADLFGYTETWTIDSWDNNWCAAFVYWCCINAGYELPIRHKNEAVSCNFAGCIAWEQWGKLPEVGYWVEREGQMVTESNHLTSNALSQPKSDYLCLSPQIGDIVLFDYICQNKEHDHIAIITDVSQEYIETAEGNFNNISAIVKRPYNNVRGYIRLPQL